MSFFNIFSRNGKNKEAIKKSKKEAKEIEVEDFSSFSEIFERYGAISFEKQQNIIDVIDNLKWELDLNLGRIEFFGGISYPIQLYGTYSNRSKSWLWIWDNNDGEYKKEILRGADIIKSYGVANNIKEFTQPYYPLSKENLDKLAMVILGLTGAGFYFLGDFGPGKVLITMEEEKFNRDFKNSPIKVTNYFPKFIAQFDVNHKNAFKHYVTAKGFKILEIKRTVFATYNSIYSDVKMEIRGTFDKLDRLLNLDGTFFE